MLLRKQEPRVVSRAGSDLAPGSCFRRNTKEEKTSKSGCVYLTASKRNGTIYLGVTSDLPARAYQHRHGLVEGFSKRYDCKYLVWFEAYDDLQEARYRELQMKKWKRAWKVALIEATNPQWKDLYETLF